MRENRAGRIAISQLTGRLARECGFAGVRIRSRIQPGAFNLAVFLDRIEEGKVSVICSDRLPEGKTGGIPVTRSADRQKLEAGGYGPDIL